MDNIIYDNGVGMIPAESGIIAYDYIVKNWNKYGIVKSRKTFIELLNILQANNENLDTFFKLCNGDYDGMFYCDILGSWKDATKNIDILKDYHVFFPSIDLFLTWAQDNYRDWNIKNDFGISFEEFIKEEYTKPDNILFKTYDGYILKLYY